MGITWTTENRVDSAAPVSLTSKRLTTERFFATTQSRGSENLTRGEEECGGWLDSSRYRGILSIAGLLVADDLVLGSEYRLLGLQLTVFGLITIMAVILGTYGGLFTGWRGWYSQMIERRSTRDEPKEYPTNSDEKQND